MRASSSIRNAAFTVLLVVLAAGMYGACSAGDDGGGAGGQAAGPGGTGGIGAMGGDTHVGGFNSGGGSAGSGGDCGYALYPTEREPGVLLLVFDQSCSMVECPDGSTVDCNACPGPSKWELASQALTTVLNDLPDELRMGLILYPDGGILGCAVASAPHVAPGPLSSTRAPILAEFNITPDGGGTPTLGGLQLGYQTLADINDSGNKAVLLVTDGAWNCGNPLPPTNEIFAAADAAYQNNGFETYVVGIQEPSGLLSHLAHLGGTDRVPGCNFEPLFSTCESAPDTCCNYTVGVSVTQELIDALEDVASQMLTNCIFAVPKGSDPSQFDPDQVNVYVDGVLVYPDDQQGWSYTGGGTDFIEIHGDLCDQLLSGEKESVEIQLGCPTVPPR